MGKTGCFADTPPFLVKLFFGVRHPSKISQAFFRGMSAEAENDPFFRVCVKGFKSHILAFLRQIIVFFVLI